MIIFRSFDITVRHISSGKPICSQKMASTQGSVMELMLSRESVNRYVFQNLISSKTTI